MVSAGHSAGVRCARDLRHELIAELYREGLPVADIAQRAGVCIKTVRNVARRAGLPPRNPPQPERDGEILARYIAGDPVDAIATDCGVRSSRVRVVAARAGIPPRQGWQRRYPLDEYAFDEPTETGWCAPAPPQACGGSADLLEEDRRSAGTPWGRPGKDRYARPRSGCRASAGGMAGSPRRRRVGGDLPRRKRAARQVLGNQATDGAMRGVLARDIALQRSLRRKRAILAEIAAYRPSKVL